MSGADIPYQLRPNKFIDRQLFVELLARALIPRGSDRYIYLSMGGNHLIDHYAIYNSLGIQAQFSFDLNPNAVARQKFNRPTDATICETMNSADLPSRMDEIAARFPRKKNLIVWLDYTTTDRKTQLQEVVQTLLRLRHGDIFRVTLNAQAPASDKWKNAGFNSPGHARADLLRQELETFMPTDVALIGEDEFASVLARCVELAVKTAEAQRPDIIFRPALLTSYKDGVRMLTVTCTASDPNQTQLFPTELFWKWKFACKGWKDINYIFAPLLSSRERHKLDSNIKRGPARMLRALRFLPAADQVRSVAAIQSYRTFHRYYPTFRHVAE
jgi:hypothetical protein